MTRARLHGLARNPALPVEALLRLAADDRLDIEDLTTFPAAPGRRGFTDAAFDALAAHPDPQLREALARSSGATGAQRARLVGDLSIAVLHAVIEGPADRWADPLPTWAYRRLADHPEPVVRDMLTYLPGTPRDVIVALARDPHPRIADAARALLRHTPAQPATMGRDQAVSFAESTSPWNRAQAAADPELPAAWVGVLATDPEPQVRLAVSMRPGLTEEQRAAIPVEIGPELPVPAWVLAAGPDELRRCARSAHIGLRRSAACHPELPADLIAALAADTDPTVRLLLCEHQPAAPPDLLLRTHLESDDDDLLRHPTFPCTGLARLASSPEPRARALARYDDAAPAPLIDQLSHDPDPAVRAAVADDPRLPERRILELLDDPATATPAAANPQLPRPAMTALLTAAGVP
ncbi:hypothetical protein MB27_35475 [Actinoplanes utahensis]|uniref:LRV domain-containing protein n=1 Tax=Actinoplanes utahensis TaxID=1869 RepID=A0A0A6UGA0_ACTUT|nr:hypothetical protein MB27_35475 [Actinoplanes utahensis]